MGLLWPDLGLSLEPLATIFIRLMLMILAPLIFSALVVALAGSGPLRATGKVAWQTLAFALILETKGEIGDVEFFDVSGWWMHGGCECISLIKGGAHRRNKKKLHLGLTGVFDEGGPGGGGDIYQAGFDVSYNLKKEKGDYSYIYIWDEEPPVKAFTETSGDSGTGTLIEIDCSEGPEPPW